MSTLPVTVAVVCTTSRPQLRQHLRTVPLGCLAGADEHLLGGGHRLPRLVGLHARRRGAGLFDQLLAVLPGARQDGLPLGCDARQLRLDLVGIGEAVGDLLPPGLEDLQNGRVGEQVQHGADDAEADDLRHEVRPVDPERPGDLLDLATALRRGLQC